MPNLVNICPVVLDRNRSRYKVKGTNEGSEKLALTFSSIRLKRNVTSLFHMGKSKQFGQILLFDVGGGGEKNPDEYRPYV